MVPKHPKIHGNLNQSLAEATVEAGQSTFLHLHRQSEELYYVMCGNGTMTLGSESFPIGPQDTVCIAPGTPHKIEAETRMQILCCSSPAYSHEDTELFD